MQKAQASGLGGKEASCESFRKWLRRKQNTEIRGSSSQGSGMGEDAAADIGWEIKRGEGATGNCPWQS